MSLSQQELEMVKAEVKYKECPWGNKEVQWGPYAESIYKFGYCKMALKELMTSLIHLNQ